MKQLLKACIYYSLLLTLFTPLDSLYSQALPPTEDVIYMKDGSIIRGKIIQLDTLSHVRIEILGGSELVYPYSEVEDIKKQLAKYRKIKLVLAREHMPVTLRQRGAYHLFSWGMGFGQTNWENSVSLNFQYSAGYHFNQYLQVGGGISYDYYGAAGFMPMFAEIRGDLTKKAIMPHYFAQFGYGFPTNKEYQLHDLEGGWMGHAGIGMRVNTKRRVDWIFTLGFKAQQSIQERYEGWDPWERRQIISRGIRRYQRIVFMTTLGF